MKLIAEGAHANFPPQTRILAKFIKLWLCARLKIFTCNIAVTFYR